MRLQLGGVLSEGAVGEAIRQARDYSRAKAIPFAAVTNGSAWIIFPATRTDEVTFEESEARVFRNLDDLKSRFVEFWELLSRERTLDGNLAHELLGRQARELMPANLRQLLPEPGYRLGRNALFDHLAPAISATLTDEALLEDVAALRKCYVKTSERLKYDSRLQVHLRDRIPPLGHAPVRVRSRSNEGKADDRIKSAAKGGRPPKFIVLLGPVGAGKTTFLHYTRKVSSAAAIDGKVLWLHVDFKKATQTDDPRRFILSELRDIIEDDTEFDLGDWEKSIRHAYSARINSLRRGPLQLLAKSDPDGFDRAVANEIAKERDEVEPYVEMLLRRASSRWPGFLIIDNVDQIDDLKLQERIFAEAQALARRVGLSVIMSLRESTFLRHSQTPVFDAFEFDSFYVDPPSVLPVLAHRFNYAKKLLEGHSIELATEQGMRVQVPDLGVFFDIVGRSVLDGRTGLLLESLSGGNVRRGLSIIREFLASGHINADHAIATYLTDGSYHFPRHEFFKGAILGSYRYFNDSVSLLPNLFDAKLATQPLQLVRLQIVNHLVGRAARGITEGLSVSELAATCSRLGMPEGDLVNTLGDLERRGMCRSVDGLPLLAESWIVPTRLAAYSIKYMCREFAYTEFCCIDSAILDSEILKTLQELTFEIEATQPLLDRLSLRRIRVEKFLEYLVLCEERWVVEAKRRGLSDEWLQQIVTTQLKPVILADGEAVIRSAKRRLSASDTSNVSDRSGASIPSDPATYAGVLVRSWPDKDYVFIKELDGSDWFSHRSDFVSEQEWLKRKPGAKCLFLRGSRQGKPRAKSVRITD